MSSSGHAISLRELNAIISKLVNVPDTCNRWVTAEVLDVYVRGGHCYMELVDKDPSTGNIMARNRGIIWANNYGRISAGFLDATGQRFATGLKVLLCVSANFHPVFGMSLIITDVDPTYTMGELQRRRLLILNRLKNEGIIDMNRTLGIPVPANRIAVISAPEAAGYGDFINQLYRNPRRLRFTTGLYHAVMQGEKAPQSIIDALSAVARDADRWDMVAIIRGGGSTSDLATLDSYELAAHVAQFPLPVIVGIGHERDTTVLDFVAALHVKTPTAAAEWLIANGNSQLDCLHAIASGILHTTTDRLTDSTRQLAYIAGSLPSLSQSAIHRASSRLDRLASIIASAGSTGISARRSRLATLAGTLHHTAKSCLTRQTDRLNAAHALLDALSPEATLRRGYTITRANGKSITNPATLTPGTEITTTFAYGITQSIVK